MITLRNISKVYKDGGKSIAVLQDINLSLERGSFSAIVGRSGSGKSTLLNILGLLDKPSSGEYRFADLPVHALSGGRLATLRNHHIGFVFQSFMLMPRMSVIENVELPLLYARGVGRRERRQRCKEALAQVGMADKLKTKAVKLSGGEKQRVAIARALVNQPDLILADEPTGNLDDASKADILAIFKRLHTAGKTVIMVTHDMEAAQVADCILRIHGGRISESDVQQEAVNAR